MADSVLVTRIDLTGLERLTRELEPRAEEIIADGAVRIQTEAMKLAPLLTGALRNSLYVTTSKSDTYSQSVSAARSSNSEAGIVGPVRVTKKLTAIISSCVDYAISIELGHVTKPFTKSYGVQNWVPARPFLTPATEAVRGWFEKAWEALFK